MLAIFIFAELLLFCASNKLTQLILRVYWTNGNVTASLLVSIMNYTFVS